MEVLHYQYFQMQLMLPKLHLLKNNPDKVVKAARFLLEIGHNLEFQFQSCILSYYQYQSQLLGEVVLVYQKPKNLNIFRVFLHGLCSKCERLSARAAAGPSNASERLRPRPRHAPEA